MWIERGLIHTHFVVLYQILQRALSWKFLLCLRQLYVRTRTFSKRVPKGNLFRLRTLHSLYKFAFTNCHDRMQARGSRSVRQMGKPQLFTVIERSFDCSHAHELHFYSRYTLILYHTFAGYKLCEWYCLWIPRVYYVLLLNRKWHMLLACNLIIIRGWR